MERMPRGIYTQEFRAQAVRLHEVNGLTIPEVAKRLSLPGGTLKNRVYAAHPRTRETCGPEWLQNDLAGHGIRAGVDRIANRPQATVCCITCC